MIFIDPKSVSRLILQDFKGVKTPDESDSNAGPGRKPIQDEVSINPENKDTKIEVVTKEVEGEKITEKLINGKVASSETYDKDGKLIRKEDFQYTFENGKEKETITRLNFDNGYFAKSICTFIEGKPQSSKFYDEGNNLVLEAEVIYIGDNERKIGTRHYKNGKPVSTEIERFVNDKLVSRTGHDYRFNEDLEERVSYTNDGENEVQNVSGTRGKGTNNEVNYTKKLINNREVLFEEFNKNNKPVFKSETKYEDEDGNKMEYRTSTIFVDGKASNVTNAKVLNDNIISSETHNSEGELLYSETFTHTLSGKIETVTRYSPSGKKEYTEDRLSNSFVYYDENDTPYLKELEDENGKTKSKTLLDLNGEPLDLNQDVETLKKHINSPERYFAFENLNSQDYKKIPLETLVAIRVYGEELCPEISSKVKELEKKYGVEINPFPLEPARYKTSLLSVNKVPEVLNDLNKEMQKYPPGFFKNRGLEICLFNEIKTKGKNGELSNNDGIQYGHLICLSSNVKEAFDHELYHFLDRNSNGDIEANDPKWVKIHGNEYPGNKSHEWYDALSDKTENSPELKTPRGFVKAYGQITVSEDQATVAEELLKPDGKDGHKIFTPRAASDNVLAKKLNQIKEEYFEWSGGMMDDDFFKAIADGVEINETYWKEREEKHEFKHNPLKVTPDPNKPKTIEFEGNQIYLKLGGPYALYYVKGGRDKDYTNNVRVDSNNNETKKPIVLDKEGLFKWVDNYSHVGDGAVLICDPKNTNKILGRIVFRHKK